MAFVKKIWEDRQSEYPNRRKLEPTQTENTYDVARDEGLVVKEGDPFNAASMNDLENRVNTGVEGVIPTLTHTRTATTHTLTGTIPTSGYATVRFKAIADYKAGDTFKIGAVTYTAKPTGEETALLDKTFITGDTVSVEVDISAKRLNFKSGGGKAYRVDDVIPPSNLQAIKGNTGMYINMCMTWHSSLGKIRSRQKDIIYALSGYTLMKFNGGGKFTDSLSSVTDFEVDNEDNVYLINVDGVEKRKPGKTKVWTYLKSELKSIAIDSQKNVYAAGYNNGLCKLSPSGTLIWTYTGYSMFATVLSIAVDEFFNVYTVSDRSPSLRKISPTGELMWRRDLTYNTVCAVDNDNNVLVADSRTLIKLSPDNTVIWQVDLGEATGDTNSYAIAGIAVDNDNNIYITQRSKGFVKKLDKDGNLLYKYDYCYATSAITLDVDGSILTTPDTRDGNNNTIYHMMRIVEPVTGYKVLEVTK